MDESIGAQVAEWLISIERVRGWFSFGKKDSKFFAELCELVERALREEEKITRIGWQD
jgi:hypothetical protein